jgi:hypothetical protein
MIFPMATWTAWPRSVSTGSGSSASGRPARPGSDFSRTNPGPRKELEQTLPDLRDLDIPGSGFAITAYTVHLELGGDAALARLRARLKARGISLMLDFVPDHTALDHPWLEDHPSAFAISEPGAMAFSRSRRKSSAFANKTASLDFHQKMPAAIIKMTIIPETKSHLRLGFKTWTNQLKRDGDSPKHIT